MDEGLRAEIIHHYLTELRRYTLAHPAWNVTIALNGHLRKSVEVKVWNDDELVMLSAEDDSLLSDMLHEAHLVMAKALGPLQAVPVPAVTPEQRWMKRWLDFGTCVRCKAVMGEPCRRMDTDDMMQREHYGRPRFSKDHEDAE